MLFFLFFFFWLIISELTEMISFNNHSWVPSQASEYTSELLKAFNITSFFITKFRGNFFSLGLYCFNTHSFPIFFPVLSDAFNHIFIMESTIKIIPLNTMTQFGNFLVIDELAKYFFLIYHCVRSFLWASCSWHDLSLNCSTSVMIVFIFLITGF